MTPTLATDEIEALETLHSGPAPLGLGTTTEQVSTITVTTSLFPKGLAQWTETGDQVQMTSDGADALAHWRHNAGIPT